MWWHQSSETVIKFMTVTSSSVDKTLLKTVSNNIVVLCCVEEREVTHSTII